MYATGEGTSRDQVAAYAWSQLAAEQGVEQAEKLRDILHDRLQPAQIVEAREIALKLVSGPSGIDFFTLYLAEDGEERHPPF